MAVYDIEASGEISDQTPVFDICVSPLLTCFISNVL